MAPLETKSLKEKYSDILKANGILDKVKSVTAHEPESLKGEHMGTSSLYVEIEFEDPSKKSKHLFAKHFIDNAGHTELIKSMRLMEKESFFFNRFLPEVGAFSMKHSGCQKALDYFPKCLHADDESVVLENIVLGGGYVMLRKEDLQDLHTAKLVLHNLAKFHAITAAMIEEKGRDAFAKNYELIAFEIMMVEGTILAPFFDNGINHCLNILKESNRNPETIEQLSGFMGKTFDMVKAIVPSGPMEKLVVVNHGDLWSNNLMFKKDPGTGQVTESVFVDLQCTRVGSPNLDIGNLLYMSVNPTVRRNHLDELLGHYFETFQKSLKALGRTCPVTFEEFFEDYKKRFINGFFMGFNLMCSAEAMKYIDVNDMSEDRHGMSDMFNNAVRAWVKENPEKLAKIETEIVATSKEYFELTSASSN